MLWARKFLVGLFSVLFVIALFSGAVLFSFGRGFDKPMRTEQWLQQSQLYNALISSATHQIEQSASAKDQNLLLGATTPFIRDALSAALPAQSVRNDINRVLDNNYAWLDGTTNHPNFSIDLTGIKPALAVQIDNAITTKVAQLPTCNSSQLSQLQSASLLTLTCRPVGINFDTTFTELKQEVTTNRSFLTNPAITPTSLNLNNPTQSQPYYQKVNYLPKLFQLSEKLPIALGGLALLSVIIIIRASSTRRGSWRLLAKLLVITSVLLLAGKLIFQIAFNKLELHFFSADTNSQLQSVATNFAHLATNYLGHILVLIAGMYIALALIIIIGLIAVQAYKKYYKSTSKRLEITPESTLEPHANSVEQVKKPKRKKTLRTMDVFAAPPLGGNQTAIKTDDEPKQDKPVKSKKRSKLNRPGSIQ